MSEPTVLRLFPLNTVLFPGAVLSIHVCEPRYRQMITECLEQRVPFGVVLIHDGDEAGDVDATTHMLGTTAEITDVTALTGGRSLITAVGSRRFRITQVRSREPYLLAEVVWMDDDDEEIEAPRLTIEVRRAFREYLRLLGELSGVEPDIALPSDPARASFVVGDALQVADSIKQRLLEIPTVQQRLTVELGFLRRLLPQLRSLVVRNDAAAAPRPPLALPTGSAAASSVRAQQERLFGKYFSLN